MAFWDRKKKPGEAETPDGGVQVSRRTALGLLGSTPATIIAKQATPAATALTRLTSLIGSRLNAGLGQHGTPTTVEQLLHSAYEVIGAVEDPNIPLVDPRDLSHGATNELQSAIYTMLQQTRMSESALAKLSKLSNCDPIPLEEIFAEFRKSDMVSSINTDLIDELSSYATEQNLSTFPEFVDALVKKGSHIATVNRAAIRTLPMEQIKMVGWDLRRGDFESFFPDLDKAEFIEQAAQFRNMREVFTKATNQIFRNSEYWRMPDEVRFELIEKIDKAAMELVFKGEDAATINQRVNYMMDPIRRSKIGDGDLFDKHFFEAPIEQLDIEYEQLAKEFEARVADDDLESPGHTEAQHKIEKNGLPGKISSQQFKVNKIAKGEGNASPLETYIISPARATTSAVMETRIRALVFGPVEHADDPLRMVSKPRATISKDGRKYKIETANPELIKLFDDIMESQKPKKRGRE